MVEVHGSARILDYVRLATVMENFNKLGEAIAYAVIKSPNAEASVEALKNMANGASGQQKADYKKALQEISDPKMLAKKLGLHQDEQLLKNLKLFADLFMGDTFEMQFIPPGAERVLVFRALLKREFLRIPSDRLRLLYGSQSQTSWVLVGSVTSTSKPNQAGPGSTESATTIPASGEAKPSLRKAFEVMFSAMGEMEKLFAVAADYSEAVVLPLAIYRSIRT